MHYNLAHTVYKRILVLSMPDVDETDVEGKNNRLNFEQRGAVFLPASSVVLKSDVPIGTEFIIAFDRDLGNERIRLNQLIRRLELPSVVFFQEEKALLQFLSGRLERKVKVEGEAEVGEVELTVRQFIDDQIPKGTDFHPKTLGKKIFTALPIEHQGKIAEKDIHHYLSRVRNKRLAEEKAQKKTGPVKPPVQVKKAKPEKQKKLTIKSYVLNFDEEKLKELTYEEMAELIYEAGKATGLYPTITIVLVRKYLVHRRRLQFERRV
jgi:hypothetical protein